MKNGNEKIRKATAHRRHDFHLHIYRDINQDIILIA
jgi:hypothetical protein